MEHQCNKLHDEIGMGNVTPLQVSQRQSYSYPSPARGGCDYAKMGVKLFDTAVNSITLTQSNSHSHPPLMSASEWRGEGRDAGEGRVATEARGEV